MRKGLEPYSFSSRQNQVLDLRTRGSTMKEIADVLGLSMSTVKCHVRRILEKTESRSCAEAVFKVWSTRQAIRAGVSPRRVRACA